MNPVASRFLGALAGLCLLSTFCAAVTAAESPSVVATPKPPAMMLNGRLEQIAGKAAQLPLYKTLKGLKVQTGKLDASVIQTAEKPQAHAPQPTYSFPTSFNGKWGGRLGITFSQYNPLVPEERHQLSLRDEGIGIFRFSTEHGKMVLDPSKLWFRPQIARKIKDFNVPQSMQSEAVNPDAKVAVALLDLGGIDSIDVHGQHVSCSVLKNTLNNLGRGVLEQNIVLQSNRRNPKDNSVRQDYTETVVRITPVQRDLMYAQIGYVQYSPAGEALAQFICQGWITRNWLAAAKGIEAMNGSTLAELGYNADLAAEAAAAGLPSVKEFNKGR
jgi:hypothetical protein